jgi:hypothetical protein
MKLITLENIFICGCNTHFTRQFYKDKSDLTQNSNKIQAYKSRFKTLILISN